MPKDLLHDGYLKDYFSESNPMITYLERFGSKQSLGYDIVGTIMLRMQALFDMVDLSIMSDRLLYAPGDRTLNFGDDKIPVRVGLGLPIAYDIWYLFGAGNVLKFGGKTIEETMEKLEGFFSEVDDAKPLKAPVTSPDPTTSTGGNSLSLVTQELPGDKEYTIKQARFEITPGDNSACYVSAGPSEASSSFVGYIAFPIGPLGVMWAIAMATESALSSGTSGSMHPVGADSSVVAGGELLPPFDKVQSECPGQKLMGKGYIVTDKSIVELYAGEFGDDPPLHKWLRYWIKEDNTEIVPGEFVAILCRPWPLHCWWHQETSPFVYSGHWIESEFYTSGIVKEVIPPEEGETGNRYRVWVKNEEIIVKSTDFLEYEEDERVGLLKTYRQGEEETYDMSMGPADNSSGQSTNFNWQHLALQNTGEALNTNWVIVPAGFYESGISMGGI